MKKPSLTCLQQIQFGSYCSGTKVSSKVKDTVWEEECALHLQRYFFFQSNKKILIGLMRSKTWGFFSILCFIKLTLLLLISYLWSWATVHDQNMSAVQGNIHTLGHWLWPNRKETLLSDMMNYLFDITDRTVASLRAQSLFHGYFYQISAGGDKSNA